MPIVGDKWEPAKGATPDDHKLLADALASASEAVYTARASLHDMIPGEAWETAVNALEVSMTLIVSARVKCHELEQRDNSGGDST